MKRSKKFLAVVLLAALFIQVSSPTISYAAVCNHQGHVYLSTSQEKVRCTTTVYEYTKCAQCNFVLKTDVLSRTTTHIWNSTNKYCIMCGEIK